MKRMMQNVVEADLQKKMVFLVGPRQVGKTWLAKEIAKGYAHPIYLNYDRSGDREIIKKELWTKETDLLIFDEIHKMKGWKGYLKGVYDTKPDNLHMLVTGSARIDTFRKGGESLAGRFFLHHLLPVSLRESVATDDVLSIDTLLKRGGFPEPALAKNDADAEKWRKQYIDGLIRYDILDFENIHSLRSMELLLKLLRDRVGSSISYSSLARDLALSHHTVKKYIEVLESLYIVFRVTPFSKNIARSILKEPKIYFFDTGFLPNDSGKRFENLVALSLLKSTVGNQDVSGKSTELHYLRTKEGKEVDFCLTEADQITLLVEAKWQDDSFAPALSAFSQKYDIPGVQLVRHLKHEKASSKVEIREAEHFLSQLDW